MTSRNQKYGETYMHRATLVPRGYQISATRKGDQGLLYTWSNKMLRAAVVPRGNRIKAKRKVDQE